MRPTESQFNELYEALNEAFSTNESLEELARMAHNETLDQIATGTSTKIKIQRMLEKALKERWLGDLLRAAVELRPRDGKLLQLSQHAQELSEEFERLNKEAQREAVCRFLEEIEDRFKTIRLLHGQEIILKDLYIPIEVTLERRYRHEVESSWGYAEDEAELSRAYALKGWGEEEEKRIQVPWKEASQEHKRLIVLADPGMGKTALLKMEAVTTAQQQRQTLLQQTSSFEIDNGIFPLFLRLSDLVDTDKEIIEAIPELVQRDYPETAPAILPLVEEKLKNGKCLLLLDALDEVPKEQRISLSEKLNRFARNYPCPVIVTSRIVGYGGGILHDVKEVEIVPFNRKQTEEYVNTWFKNAKGCLEEPEKLPDAKGLINELQQKPQIRGLTQNPLLLSLLCSLYQEDELCLPTRRVQIYEQAIHYMLYEWRRVSERRLTEKALIDNAWVEAKLELLEELAYQFSCENKEIFSMRELSDKIKVCKSGTDFEDSKTPDLIKELSEEDGIIQQLDGEGRNTRYIFLHRTFQEYLTASYLSRQQNKVELAQAHFRDLGWNETLGLLVGSMPDPIPLLEAIIDEKKDINLAIVLLPYRCIVECQNQAHPLISKLIRRIEILWCMAPNAAPIFSAIVALSQVNEEMFEKVQQKLYDEDIKNKYNAIMALGKIGNPIVTEQLISFLRDDDLLTRYFAISALGDMGDQRAIAELAYTIDYGEPEIYKALAAGAIKQIGTPEATEVLITAMSHTSIAVRVVASQALIQIGSERGIEGLEALLNHEQADVQEWASDTLERIKSAPTNKILQDFS